MAMWDYYSLDFPVDFRNLYISSYEFIHGLPIYDEEINKSTWIGIAQEIGFDSRVMPGKPSLLFNYPPWVAVIFSPFVLLPFYYAAILWYLMLIGTYFTIAWLLPKTFEITFSLRAFFEILLLIFAFKFTKGSFTVGQPAYVTFLLGLSSLWFYRKNKTFLAGVFLGLATIKPTVALPFFIFFGFKLFSDGNLKVEAINFKVIHILLVSISVVLSCFLAQYFVFHRSPMADIQAYGNALVNYRIFYCNGSFYQLQWLASVTEFMVLLKYMLGNGVCDYLWTGSVAFLLLIGGLYFTKVYVKWSDARLLLVISLANLLGSYHLYHDCICFLLLYFVWDECPAWVKTVIFSLILFDLAPSHEKLLPYLPSNVPFIWTLNNYELPLRVMILFIVICFYSRQSSGEEFRKGQQSALGISG
jgi:hypothetical protein